MQILKTIYYKWVYRKSSVRYKSRLESWPVLSESNSYENDRIIDQVKNATESVVKGDAAFERDGVLFKEIIFNQGFVTAFFLAVKFHGKHHAIRLVDFGGSLGSLYWQHRELFFPGLIDSWNIIEQTKFVSVGQECFKMSPLNFKNDINEIEEEVDLIIFSSVLQYLENYGPVIQKVIHSKHPPCILIDRTAVTQNETFITRQFVDKNIVESTYPIRIFSENELIALFKQLGYSLQMTWLSYCDPANFIIEGEFINWKGFLFVRNDEYAS